MHKQISYKIVSLVFGILVFCFAITFYAVGWTEPNQAPPGCTPGDPGCDPPVNVGPTGQVKLGAFGVYGVFRAVGGADPATESGLVVNNGNVGIGTTNPTQKLDVVGYVKGQTGLCIGNDCRNSWNKAFNSVIYVSATTEPLYLSNWFFGKLITLFNNGGADPIDVVLPDLSALSSDDVGRYFMFATYNAVGPSGDEPFRIITNGAKDTFYGNVNNKRIYGYISNPRLTSIDGDNLQADWDNDAFTACKVYFMEEWNGNRYWLFEGSPLGWDKVIANYLQYPFTGI